ncbi:branched-chain amino acid transport system II carrier protein [Sphingobacterium litopenaei]|uniref:Branched-chain amino acid transport system II carrier protein n=1 Tax=Sphingobacterium litopenaei TaxID=2763500 RepID=A0ABR7YDY0_9SPHI|nr:branched-chain amino acid transport system II carrier protein [Sphingobacterium litopenaei]MBD1429501.1 branched-chain amino acid transport system II carrier protein [Sphingobacterium litopenaei]
MKKNQDIITIGFALFAMFFGAGNLLLPPFIGLQIGDHVWITILAFGLTGILLPFLGILSIVKSGNSLQDLGNKVHPKLAPILGFIIMLCIGPLIAIPRTAATTYEVGLLPNFPNFNPIVSSILFFGITWALTIVPSKVVDIIGNILTPALLILLLLLIAVGIFNPLGEYSSSSLTALDSFSLGFTEGYQTLDVLASVIFAGIIIHAAKAKGYNSVQEKSSVVISSGALSAICLFIIYGGLVYLGATSNIADASISRSALLIHIAKSTLGDYGMIAISISIALACLTTSIALTSAVGSFFSDLSGGKLSYKLLVTLCCVVSAALAVTGVDNIIKFAYPPLAFVYPIVITLVLYIILFGSFVKTKQPYIGALIGATLIAIIGVLKILGLLSPEWISRFNLLPFFDIDLGWILPSFIGFIIGLLMSKAKKLATL